jgi:uncharacterized protein YndB with AHSA1/START domain
MSRTVVVLVAPVSVTMALYALWIRPRMLTWGATREEIDRVYPTDDLIPDHDSSTFTMATTLPAPPEKVWLWIAQMGGDRAGWYSWDRLDHWGVPSSDRIVPEWQNPHVGQHLANTPDGSNVMTVTLVEPNRTLALRTNMEFPSRRSFDPSEPLPRVYMDGIWSFHLQPTLDGQTRLVARMRGRSHPKALLRPPSMLFGDLLHFTMQVRQFHNLRTRVRAHS